jgi:hypothetical protein
MGHCGSEFIREDGISVHGDELDVTAHSRMNSLPQSPSLTPCQAFATRKRGVRNTSDHPGKPLAVLLGQVSIEYHAHRAHQQPTGGLHFDAGVVDGYQTVGSHFFQ